MPTSPRAEVLAAGGVALFWISTLVTGALAPDYSVRNDYISSLAGRGSEVAALGVANLLVLGLVHLAAAAALRGAATVPLVVAGLAGLVVAVFRTGCPEGASGCGFEGNGGPDDLADTLHGVGVLVYEYALLAAMVAVVIRLVGRRTTAAVSLALLTVVAGVLSVVFGLQIGEADNGWWQRAWLLVNTGWVVLAVLTARRERVPIP